MNRQLVVTLLVVLLFNSSLSRAAQQDDDFEDLVFDLCVRDGLELFNEGWSGPSLNALNNLCLTVLPGGATPSSDYVSSSNIGSSGATGKTASNTA
jgi:hypothetical protein